MSPEVFERSFYQAVFKKIGFKCEEFSFSPTMAVGCIRSHIVTTRCRLPSYLTACSRMTALMHNKIYPSMPRTKNTKFSLTTFSQAVKVFEVSTTLTNFMHRSHAEPKWTGIQSFNSRLWPIMILVLEGQVIQHKQPVASKTTL